MARQLRIEYRGAFYHIINRGQSRRDIFLEDKGRHSFLELLGELVRLWKVGIHAYCLMSNHYHLSVNAGGRSGASNAPSRWRLHPEFQSGPPS